MKELGKRKIVDEEFKKRDDADVRNRSQAGKKHPDHRGRRGEEHWTVENC